MKYMAVGSETYLNYIFIVRNWIATYPLPFRIVVFPVGILHMFNYEGYIHVISMTLKAKQYAAQI